jgi:PAS domain S-box-containing protein
MAADLKETLEYVSDGIVALDAGWKIEYVNRRAELLMGRPRTDLVGEDWWSVVDYLLQTPAEEEFRSAAAGQIPRRFRVFHPPRYAWHQVQAIPNDGGLLLVMEDITDVARARQQAAVRDAVREVVDHAPVAISVLRGPDHRIEVMNQVARQILGGRDLEGSSARLALPELEEQGFFKILDDVYSSGTAYHARQVPVRFDRTGSAGMEEAIFDIVYQPIFDVDGRVNGVLSMSIEVTTLTAEKRRLDQRTRELEAVLEQLLHGVIITDAEGRITFVNELASQLHGVAKLDVPPDEYTEAYSLLTETGDPYPAHQLPLARAVLHDEVVKGARWRIRRPDGSEANVIGEARPVYDGDGKKIAAVLTLHAVSDRRA